MSEGISVQEKASYIRDAVFAADDGIITTFAVVAGSYGAALSPSIILILGFANLLADGFSMATGIYMGVKSEKEYEKSQKNPHWRMDSPIKNALVTYVSFVGGGFLPLVPYLIDRNANFIAAAVVVAVSLFMVGVIKGLYVEKHWLRSGFEVLGIGGVAASIAYLVGFLIDRYII